VYTPLHAEPFRLKLRAACSVQSRDEEGNDMMVMVIAMMATATICAIS
jgi:hypothetical protein